MAVSLRDRPVIRGEDARRFLSEKKRVDECRAQLTNKDGQVSHTVSSGKKKKRTVHICLTE